MTFTIAVVKAHSINNIPNRVDVYLMRLSNNEHNPSIVSGNIAYLKPTKMGYGTWSYTYAAYKAVDGDTYDEMSAHHCSVVQNAGIIPNKFKIDLMDFYDIEKLVIHTTRGKCIYLDNIHDSSSIGILTIDLDNIHDSSSIGILIIDLDNIHDSSSIGILTINLNNIHDSSSIGILTIGLDNIHDSSSIGILTIDLDNIHDSSSIGILTRI